MYVSSHRCANAVSAPHSSASVCPNPVSPAFLSGPASSGAAVPAASSSSSQKPVTLAMEQSQLPVTGARKARVLYDYDAHDTSELSLLADEVQQSQAESPHTHTSLHFTSLVSEVWLFKCLIAIGRLFLESFCSFQCFHTKYRYKLSKTMQTGSVCFNGM